MKPIRFPQFPKKDPVPFPKRRRMSKTPPEKETPMEGVITAITVQKKNPDRFNIFLDHQYAFSLGRDLAQTLSAGQVISQSAMETLKQWDEKNAAFSRALYYLHFRPRSHKEMAFYLTKKEFSPEAVRLALARLTDLGYIDDREFARLWVSNRCRFRPRGAYVLKGELREKGIDEEIIREALSEVDELQSAWDAARSRLSKMKPPGSSEMDRRELDKKILKFLSRRGFSWDICRAVCDRVWKEHMSGSAAD